MEGPEKCLSSVYPRSTRLNVSSEDSLTLAGLWTNSICEAFSTHLKALKMLVFQQMRILNLILLVSKHSSWHP